MTHSTTQSRCTLQWLIVAIVVMMVSACQDKPKQTNDSETISLDSASIDDNDSSTNSIVSSTDSYVTVLDTETSSESDSHVDTHSSTDAQIDDSDSSQGSDSQQDNDTGTEIDTNTDIDSNTDTDSDSNTDSDSHQSAVCFDGNDTFTFGVSSYGSIRQWAIDANEISDADFRYLYIYILDGGMSNAEDFRDWYIAPFIVDAVSIGATPFFTFYQLLDIGKRLGYTGNEPQIVHSCMNSNACMTDYFNNYIWFLEVLADLAPTAVVHVEPDSWGFMMWAMGTEGNSDAQSIGAQVAATGIDDVQAFENTAAGLGQAMVALRNKYAPSVRLGWHASNFRVSTRPEVVTSFFSTMGSWDLLVTEHIRGCTDDATWWNPWDDALFSANRTWFQTLTNASGLPMMLWQVPVGDHDYHLLEDGPSYSYISQIAQDGVIGALFDHVNNTGESSPDDYRSFDDFGAVPPAQSDAGGTAAHMRERVATYAQQPISLPGGQCP